MTSVELAKVTEVFYAIREYISDDIQNKKKLAEALDRFFAYVGPIEDGTALDEPWDPKQITWTDCTGPKGPYQRSEDINNIHHRRMLKQLASAGGKITRDGVFYWTFENGSTVGRKQRKGKSQ